MQTTNLFGRRSRQQRELAGLDNLELPLQPRQSSLHRLWSGAWPQLAAIGIALLIWQIVVLLELKPVWVLPGPVAVLGELWHDLTKDIRLFETIATTMRRAALGFGLALVIGSVIGLAVTRWKLLRTAVASLITGLQTMPSIAWFPLAILVFGLNEQAILFVVVLGAAPSVANGVIHGVDHIPRILLNAGRVLGARGLDKYRFVILPAALPSFISGLKQAWAFAWRSLMAGELLVIIAAQPALGVRLQLQREVSDATALIGTMIVILTIGIIVDLVIFGRVERRIRERRGLTAGT
jgi:sulfonate transport system permease protein